MNKIARAPARRKQAATGASVADEPFITVDTTREGDIGEIVTIRVGDVVVRGPRPSEEERQRNLLRSQEAMEGLMKALLKPGFRLYKKKGVPYFHADPTDVTRLIRRLDGKEDVGRVVDGVFQVIE